jgi:hypothetical protein
MAASGSPAVRPGSAPAVRPGLARRVTPGPTCPFTHRNGKDVQVTSSGFKLLASVHKTRPRTLEFGSTVAASGLVPSNF